MNFRLVFNGNFVRKTKDLGSNRIDNSVFNIEYSRYVCINKKIIDISTYMYIEHKSLIYCRICITCSLIPIDCYSFEQ